MLKYNKFRKQLDNTLPLDDDEQIISSKDLLKQRTFSYKSVDSEEEKSRAFIKKLQEEEEKAYMEEKERRRKKLQETEAQMICNICLGELMSQAVHTLDSCDHVFHEDCLKEHVLSEIKTRKAAILCPQGECKAEINIEEMRDVLSNQQIEEFYKGSIESYVDNHGQDVEFYRFLLSFL